MSIRRFPYCTLTLLLRCLVIITSLSSSRAQQKFVETDKTPLTKNIGRNRLFYEAPQYPVRAPSNLVVGGYFRITDPDGQINIIGAENALSVVCALDSINKGTFGYQISTKLDLLAYDLDTRARELSASTTGMNILKYDLYYGNMTKLQSKAIDDVNITIGTVIGDGIFQDFYLVFPIFEGFRVPVLDYSTLSGSSLTSADYIPVARNFRSAFRLTPIRGASLGQAFVEICRYFNWTLITPIFGDDFFGFDGQTQILTALNEGNITTVCSQVVNVIRENTTNSDVTNVSKCLNKNDARVVILYMGSQQALLAAKQLQAQSNVGFLTFIGPSDSVPATTGSIFYEPFSVRGLGADDGYEQCFNATNPQWLAENAPYLLKYWEAKFSCQIKGENLTTCPESLNSRKIPCLCTGTESLKNVNTTYRVAYVADTVDLLGRSIYYIENNCSYLTAMSLKRSPNTPTDFCTLQDFTPTNLVEAIGYLDFQGRTGPLSFANQTGIRLTPNVTIQQAYGNGSVGVIGAYSKNLTIFDNKVYFYQNKTPVSEILVDEPDLSYAVVDVFFALSLIGIIISLAITIFIIVYRNNRVIRKTSPIFCILILVGVDFVFLSLIFSGISLSRAVCFLQTWFLVIGAGLIIANILAKNYRIYRIFNNVSGTALTITDLDLIYFNLVILAGELILLCIYSFVGGVLQPFVFTSSSDPLYQYAVCQVPSSAIQTTFTIIIYAYNIFLIICAAVLAFLTRRIGSTYSESRYIAFIIYSYLLIALIILPLLYTAGDGDDSALFKYIYRAVGTCLAMYMTIGALFIPKISDTLRVERKRHKIARQSQNNEILNESMNHRSTIIHRNSAAIRSPSTHS